MNRRLALAAIAVALALGGWVFWRLGLLTHKLKREPLAAGKLPQKVVPLELEAIAPPGALYVAGLTDVAGSVKTLRTSAFFEAVRDASQRFREAAFARYGLKPDAQPTVLEQLDGLVGKRAVFLSLPGGQATGVGAGHAAL